MIYRYINYKFNTVFRARRIWTCFFALKCVVMSTTKVYKPLPKCNHIQRWELRWILVLAHAPLRRRWCPLVSRTLVPSFENVPLRRRSSGKFAHLYIYQTIINKSKILKIYYILRSFSSKLGWRNFSLDHKTFIPKYSTFV